MTIHLTRPTSSPSPLYYSHSGPSGCGKSVLARAIPAACGYSVFEISLADMLHAGVGESEKRLRETFRAARMAVPCVIVLDNVDTLFPSASSSGGDGGAGGGDSATLLAEMLSLLDSLNSLESTAALDSTAFPSLVPSPDARVLPPEHGRRAGAGGDRSTNSQGHGEAVRVQRGPVFVIATCALPSSVHPTLLAPGRLERYAS